MSPNSGTVITKERWELWIEFLYGTDPSVSGGLQYFDFRQKKNILRLQSFVAETENIFLFHNLSYIPFPNSIDATDSCFFCLWPQLWLYNTDGMVLILTKCLKPNEFYTLSIINWSCSLLTDKFSWKNQTIQRDTNYAVLLTSEFW